MADRRDRSDRHDSLSPERKRRKRSNSPVRKKHKRRSRSPRHRQESYSPEGKRRRKRSDSPVSKKYTRRSRSPRHRPREDVKERHRRHSSTSPARPEKQYRRYEKDVERRKKHPQSSEGNDDGGTHSKPNKQRDDSPRRKEPEHSARPSQPSAQKKDPTSNGGSGTQQKEGPDFERSGRLAAETNTFNGVIIKYAEPPEARVPKTRWRLYQFKGDEYLNTLYIHRQSAYLIGRDRKVVDFPIDHPSCSKQHAVIQYRLVDYVKEDGRKGRKVKPYIIDLESTNGSYVNNQRIETSRYVEMKEKDMIKFGFSTREYVLLHENSKDSDDDDDDDDPTHNPTSTTP